MSGPWDRPSDDREPLASDRDAAAERPEAGEAPGDAWPSSDPWSDQRPAAGSGWDDWSTLRPPDDFVLEEPVSTLGDPWAESWVAEEEADRRASDAPPPEPERWAEPEPEPARRAVPEPEPWAEPPRVAAPEPEGWARPEPELEPWVASEPEPAIAAGADAGASLAGQAEAEIEPAATGDTAWAPMPVAEHEPARAPWEPPGAEDQEPTPGQPAFASAGPSTREQQPPVDPWGAAATEPDVDVAASEVPHVAPWQASDDPWAAVLEREEALPVEAGGPDETSGMPSDTLAEAASAAPETEEPEPGTEQPEPKPEAEPVAGGATLAEEPEPVSTTGGWRRELLPAWLTGRTASAAQEPAEPPEPVAEVADAEAEPALPDAELPSAAEVPVDAPGDWVASAAEAQALEGSETDTETDAPTIAPSAEEEAVLAGDGRNAGAAPPPLTGSWEAESVAPPTDVPSAATAEPIGAVTWENDQATVPDEPVAAAAEGEIGTGGAEAEAAAEGETGTVGAEAEAAAEADAAAEFETAASAHAWPEADVVAATASLAEDDDVTEAAVDEAGDRRFDAWRGAPVIGAAAAGADELDVADATGVGAAQPEVVESLAVETEAAPGDAVGVADAPAPMDAAPSTDAAPDAAAPIVEAREAEGGTEAAPVDARPWGAAAAASQSLADDEAWVAEPEAWEPAPSALEPTSPDAEPVEDVEQPGRSPWAAAAAAGAAGAAAGAAPGGAESTVAPGEAQPPWRPDWLPDLEELEPEEGTRVLPTDWTPPPATAQPTDRGQLEPHATAARTRPAADVERELDEEAEPDASTAEQAVPWLIGFILLLAGMVIVLLALIFAGDGSLGGGSGQPTPDPSLAAGVVGTPIPSPTPDGSTTASASPAADASATPAPTGDAVAGPQFGPIELVFQGRAAALAPIYLLHREFTTQEEASVLAQDPNLDVRRFAWAMDGTLGAGLYADLMVSIEPGVEKRQLGDEISALTFGQTTTTVYAVRVTQEGANDVAVVLAIDYASGDTAELARLTYPRPAAESRAALKEAQYQDEGGSVRLFWMEDNQLRLWVLNGGMWEIDPSDGAVTEMARQPPVLWSPDGRQTIAVTEEAGTTTLTRIDVDGTEHATATVEGLVSHIRWSPESNRIVFTVGRSTSSGGVLQDLFLWDLGEEAPTQVTATGAAFGAEWMGSRVRWREEPGET